MVGKNNNYVRESKSNEHFQRFALRKLSVGVVSVAVAAGFYLGSGATAQAATTEPDTSAKTEQVVQQDSTSTASDVASASNASAAVLASSTVPTSAEPVSKVTASDSAVSASSASASQVSAANASESSSQPASSSVASNTAATVSKDSQAASETNSQSAADTQTAQLPTSATSANESQSANVLSAQAVRQAANQQAPAGFTVTDPTYPAEMYKDPDASHYTYWWAQSSDGEYNLVLSTDRNGDGKVYVFLLGNNNNVLGQYTVDKNKSTEVATDDEGDFGTVYNDGQSGVFVSSDGTWKSKFNVFDSQAGKDERNYNSLSFMIPQVETQTTTYVNGEGNTVSDPVIQNGLDGQIYTTQGGQVINGYFAKEPSNATGYMSPFGKKNVTYTKDWHNGTKAEFTEIDTATGLMRVKVFEQGRSGRWEKVDEFDLAYGESEKVKTDYSDITIHSIYIPQTINIQYVYEKLGNLIIDSDSKAFPADDKKTTQYPNDENDSTRAGNVTIPKVAGFTPTINGKTVTNYTFNPSDYVSDLSQNITVVYEADWQQAQANFYDETTGKQIAGTHESQNGKTGEMISFDKDPNEVIKELKAKGYVFDKDNANNNVFTTGTTYDNDSTAHQYFNYYFTHATTIVTPDNPKTPVDVLPDNPGKNYPSGVAKDDLNKTVTRTINIKTPDGKTQMITQKAEFTRSATVDEVTGEVTYGSWSNNVVLGSADVPNIPGYTPSTSVPEITVTPNDQDMTINVTYQADQQFAHTVYLDADENNAHVPSTPGGSLPDKTVIQNVEIKGVTGGKIDYAFDAAHDQNYAAISNYYNLKSVDVPSTFDNDDDNDQIVYVYLTHRTEDVSNTDPQAKTTATRTINVTTPDGKTSSEKQIVNYKRTATEDLVTSNVTYGKWQADGAPAWQEYTPTPQKGYTTLIDGVAGTKVDQKTPAFNGDKPVDETVNITYQADAQEAAINFYDETDHKQLDDQTIHLTGKTGEKVDRTQAEKTLAELEKQGYVLDKENTAKAFPADAVYDNDDQTPQEFTIYLKHGMTHTDATDKNAEQKIVTETIHYVYEDNQTAKPDYTSAVDFKRGYTTDNVTGKVVSYDPWTVSSKTFGAVKSPVIAGYTADQAEVAAQTVTPDSQNIVKTVYYTADTQEAAINFYDETDHKLLDDQTIHLTGKTGKKVDRTQAEKTLAELEKQGYVLDKENTAKAFPADAVYDNDDQTPQEFTIYLKHGTTHTDATSSKADQKTVSETIQYVYKDGVNANKPAADNYNTTVTFKRGYTTDNVTHKIVSYDPWTVDGKQADSKTFGAVKSPVIAGYTADQAEVAAQTVKPDSQNINKTVYYTADTQEAAINFYDETDHKLLDNQTIHLTGKTGEKVDRTQAEKTLADLVKQGYVLDEDNTKLGFPADATYDNDDVAPQEFTIYLKHGMTHTDATDKNAEQKIVTETIHYVYENNQTAQPDYTSAVDFKRGYTTDNVTGKVVSYDPWTVSSKKFGVVKSPIIEGYTPNYSQIDEITVTPDSKDVVKTVVYVGNAQEAQAIFYDETTGKEISGTREIATGKSDEAINFTKDPSEIVKELEAKGYVFDKSNANNKVFVDGSTYDKNSEVHQYFKYYFTHGHATVTPEQDPQNGQKTVTQTIKYQYADGTATGLADNVQTLTFKRTGDKDLVTGKVTWPDWSTVAAQQTKSTVSPAIKGYTADTSEIPAVTYHAGDSDTTYVVKYNADAQHAVINYIDGESDEILHTDKVNGHSDEKINYSTADMIKQLEAKGYELYKDNFSAGEKFDNDDATDQTYTVIFKHHRENVDPNHSSADGTKGTKTLTETVHYKYADGTKAAEDQTAQVTFTRNGVLDDVTGIVAWGKWNEASQSYKALTSPTIAGYTPSEAVVKRSSNSDAEQGPTVTVIYTA
ncbi:YSIRK-type signal peptide-containing protein, partial [Limosilactobacillus mucosae]|uniref:mucin-binding protein n=1 Tax=Limosilactobacillus mucosae TaxID=97478 RepID=UPI00233F1C5B